MKKIFLAFSVTVISAAGVNAHAQFSLSDSSHYYINPSAETTYEESGRIGVPNDNDHSNEINSRAAEHFRKTYPNAKNIYWCKIKDGYVASFENNSVQSRAVYNQKGWFSYTMSYYGEKNLPRDVWAGVKSTYYAYDIFKVTEVNAFDKTAYVVFLQNETEIKIIRVCEGETEEMQRFTKGS